MFEFFTSPPTPVRSVVHLKCAALDCSEKSPNNERKEKKKTKKGLPLCYFRPNRYVDDGVAAAESISVGVSHRLRRRRHRGLEGEVPTAVRIITLHYYVGTCIPSVGPNRSRSRSESLVVGSDGSAGRVCVWGVEKRLERRGADYRARAVVYRCLMSLGRCNIDCSSFENGKDG